MSRVLNLDGLTAARRRLCRATCAALGLDRDTIAVLGGSLEFDAKGVPTLTVKVMLTPPQVAAFLEADDGE